MSTPKLSRYEDENGRFCSFFIVNGVGHKLYTEKWRALACLRTQRFLYKLGLAPKPGKFFSLKRCRHDGLRYGYTTEVAQAAGDNASYHVYDVLQKRNIRYLDCAYFNLGIIRGKYVVVDCDPEEFFYNNCNKEFRKLVGV